MVVAAWDEESSTMEDGEAKEEEEEEEKKGADDAEDGVAAEKVAFCHLSKRARREDAMGAGFA